MYLIKLGCYDVDSYCSIFEDQESDYSRGRRFFSMTHIHQWDFSQDLEICAYCTTKGLGLSTACNLGISRWGQYSSHPVFYIQQLFFLCALVLIYYYSVLRLYQEKLPSSSPCVPQQADDVHSATHSPCPKELIVKMGREPKARRREVTHPKTGARA